VGFGVVWVMVALLGGVVFLGSFLWGVCFWADGGAVVVVVGVCLVV